MQVAVYLRLGYHSGGGSGRVIAKMKSLLSKVRSKQRNRIQLDIERQQKLSKEDEKNQEGPLGFICCASDKSVAVDRDGTTSIAASTGSIQSSKQSSSIQMGYERFDDEQPKTPTQKLQEKPENNRSEQPHIIKELYTFFLRRSWKKKLFTILAIGMIIPVILDVFILRTGYVTTFLDNFLEWMRENELLGVWSYIAVLAVASLIFIPPSILIFGAGFTFQSVSIILYYILLCTVDMKLTLLSSSQLWGASGIFIALIASYLGSIIGGLIGFWRARYMTRDLIEVLMRRYPIIKAVDAAIVKNSLRVMVLMRLNCLIPFGVMNYVFGVTGVDWAVYSLAMVGILPWHLLLICLGASSATVYAESGSGVSMLQIILMSTGAAFGIISLAITWKFAKKELQKEVDAVPADQPTSNRDMQIKPKDIMPFRSPNRKIESKSEEQSVEVSNGVVEDADLHVGDYFLIQCLGMGEHRSPGADEEDKGVEVDYSSYRKKLGWNEILLDDFS